MKNKILIGSILAAVLIILTSLTPVIGSSVTKSTIEKNSIVTPLFTIRSKHFLNKHTHKISSNYLGIEKTSNLHFPLKDKFHDWLNKIILILENKPTILDLILTKLEKKPEFINLLNTYNININEFKNDLIQIKNDPSLLTKIYVKAEQTLGKELKVPLDDPIQPLGLIEQWFPGALILALVLLPFLVLVGILIATITIITCIIPQCLEGIIEIFVTGIIQGLHQPDN